MENLYVKNKTNKKKNIFTSSDSLKIDIYKNKKTKMTDSPAEEDGD